MIEYESNWFGFVSEEQAAKAGFKYHASYFGPPIWFGDPASMAPEVLAKVVWLDWLIPVISSIESVLWLFHSWDPGFTFKIKGPIGGS